MRLQTFCEDRFEFRVLADVFATCNWALLPDQPWISIVPGAPAAWRAVLPTLRRVGETFALSLRADDRWGNPSHRVRGRFCLKANCPVDGLPQAFTWPTGERSHRLEGLSAEPGDLVIALLDEAGSELAISNPLRIATELDYLPFWADMHGQSEETIGTNSARRLAEYARDLAFVDAMCHQGNDFQITKEFWKDLNDLTREFDQPGRFIFFPGYEWSGNTALGGDRNVVLKREGHTLHRSSHALVEDVLDANLDTLEVKALHAVLRLEGDVLCLPHVGGRYADLLYTHDTALERSVEVHSDWGTFDWLLDDAFAVGGRVGIAANSDGHKGRQGASHPGASLFGAYGGLTCYLAKDLSRDALWDAMLWRRQYATTGACRAHLDARVRLIAPAEFHRDDPALGGAPVGRVTEAGLGAILTHVADTEVEFSVEVLADAPIERIEIRNRTTVLEVWRPYARTELGHRIRVLWEGAEYRGRGPGDDVAGRSCLIRQQLERHPCTQSLQSRSPVRSDAAGVAFRRRHHRRLHGRRGFVGGCAGGYAGDQDQSGSGQPPVTEIDFEDRVFDAGGLGRRIRTFRLPDENPHRHVRLSRRIPLRRDEDNALYVRVTLEDGNVLWSSPIYLIVNDGRRA